MKFLKKITDIIFKATCQEVERDFITGEFQTKKEREKEWARVRKHNRQFWKNEKRRGKAETEKVWE